MSDRRAPVPPPSDGEGVDATLPAWMADALRRPVAVDAAAPGRIMALVRAAPRPYRASVLPLAPRRPRWATRRGVLAPGGGAVLAALLTAFLWIGGGSVPAPAAAGDMSAVVLRDTVLGDALQDTLRLVRLMLAAPGASRVVATSGALGDATPLRRDPRTGIWFATVVAPRDAVSFAFVVDGRPRRGPAVDAAPPAAPAAPDTI